MRARPIYLLACSIVLLSTLPSPTASAPQHILISKGIQGRQFSPSMAVDPNTGDVLAAWIAIDPKDGDKRTVWTRLLKRARSGKYRRKKPLKLAPGNKGAKAINNGSPHVVWAPGMRAFYVVWQAYLDNGTSEIRGRIVKRRTGKARGGIKTLAKGGDYNASPQVDAILVNGHHQGVVTYTHKPTGAAFDELERTLRPFARNGKAQGTPTVLKTGGSDETLSAGAYLVDATSAAASTRRAPDRELFIEIRPVPPSDSGKCEYVLWDLATATILDTREISGRCSRGERIRLSNTEFRVIWRDPSDSAVTEALMGVNPDTLKIEEIRRAIWDPAEVVHYARFTILWIDLSGDDLNRGTRDAPTLDPDGDLFALTWDAGEARLLRVTKNGAVTSSQAFDYDDDISSLSGGGFAKDGVQQAVVVYTAGPFREEQLMADVLELPQ